MYHHQATAEQKAKAQERREKVKTICDQIAALPEAERAALAAKCLAVTVEGHTLSPFNQCLVAYQFESATIVGGFQQWRKNGRQVKKGEHGISIWIPKTSKEKSEPTDKPNEHIGFFLGTIFDVSQTEPITEKESQNATSETSN